MADINQLGQLQEGVLDLDTYADIGGGAERKPRFQFPKAGRYTLRAPDAFPDEAFGRTTKDTLSVQIDPTIVGPTNDGLTVRFQRISATMYERKGSLVSKVGDYLRACGLRGRLTSEEDIKDAVRTTANQIYEAQLDWRLYAKGHGEGGTTLEIRGMENFPKDENGEPLNYVFSKTKTDENGKPVRLRANLDIVWFYPANA